jgi:hypothetical protein
MHDLSGRLRTALQQRARQGWEAIIGAALFEKPEIQFVFYSHQLEFRISDLEKRQRRGVAVSFLQRRARALARTVNFDGGARRPGGAVAT